MSRRLRHVKTDRLDGERLLAKLIRHHAGERGGWSVVRVPSPEEEDARHLHRELGRLKRERLAHRVRMQSLLVTQGIKLKIKSVLRLRLGELTLWDERPLYLELKAKLEREQERLALVERQIDRLESEPLAGLVDTPYNGGESERDQGISKAGNRRVRAMIIEIAWLWLRFQPKVRSASGIGRASPAGACACAASASSNWRGSY